ncbi:hypothetical protein Tco_1386473 [Tanacetum coccineum]
MSRAALTVSLDSITHKQTDHHMIYIKRESVIKCHKCNIQYRSTKDSNIKRKGSRVGLSIGMKGCEGTSIACPRSDMPLEGQPYVETLDCSVVKLLTTPRKPTTSCRKLCTSSSILSILCDMVRGYGSGGGGGGACACVGIS